MRPVRLLDHTWYFGEDAGLYQCASETFFSFLRMWRASRVGDVNAFAASQRDHDTIGPLGGWGSRLPSWEAIYVARESTRWRLVARILRLLFNGELRCDSIQAMTSKQLKSRQKRLCVNWQGHFLTKVGIPDARPWAFCCLSFATRAAACFYPWNGSWSPSWILDLQVPENTFLHDNHWSSLSWISLVDFCLWIHSLLKDTFLTCRAILLFARDEIWDHN